MKESWKFLVDFIWNSSIWVIMHVLFKPLEICQGSLRSWWGWEKKTHHILVSVKIFGKNSDDLVCDYSNLLSSKYLSEKENLDYDFCQLVMCSVMLIFKKTLIYCNSYTNHNTADLLLQFKACLRRLHYLKDYLNR